MKNIEPKGTPITDDQLKELMKSLASSLCGDWNDNTSTYDMPDDDVIVNGFTYPRWRTKTHLVTKLIGVLKDNGFTIVSDGKGHELEEILNDANRVIEETKKLLS